MEHAAALFCVFRRKLANLCQSVTAVDDGKAICHPGFFASVQSNKSAHSCVYVRKNGKCKNVLWSKAAISLHIFLDDTFRYPYLTYSFTTLLVLCWSPFVPFWFKVIFFFHSLLKSPLFWFNFAHFASFLTSI